MGLLKIKRRMVKTWKNYFSINGIFISLKVSDKVVIEPAGSRQGIVTAVENGLIPLAVDNNGFAKGSKVLLKNADKFGRLGAKKAEVKAVGVNSIVLEVLDNSFKIKDRLNIAASPPFFWNYN